MQILIVFKKSNRQVIAAFELQTIITEMNVLKIPDVDYLMTTKRDVLFTDSNGQLWLKEI
jgi:hypothetical protein